jgi:hypothetical protein
MTGTCEWRMIRDAREPRDTRAGRSAGAGADHEHVAVAPSTSSIASSELAPWPTTAGAWPAAASSS